MGAIIATIKIAQHSPNRVVFKKKNRVLFLE